jgi:hypothetical protein
MASKTSQHKTVMRNKRKKMGRDRKRLLATKGSTPLFPIHHPERHAGLVRPGKASAATGAAGNE